MRIVSSYDQMLLDKGFQEGYQQGFEEGRREVFLNLLEQHPTTKVKSKNVAIILYNLHDC